MKREELAHIESLLQDVASNTLALVHPANPTQNSTLPAGHLQARINGKGKRETYTVFPGIEVSFDAVLASTVNVHHALTPSVLEAFYCHSGRVGWNMQGGTAVYLGTGDMTVHSAACCAESAMMFPLRYAEGISISMDLERLASDCPAVLRKAGIDLQKLQTTFCAGGPVIIPACPALEWLFEPLYTVPLGRRLSWLQLKVQELLLYLNDFQPDASTLTPYGSQQTDLIKEIHQLLTGHLDQRFTIEELSKKYLINVTTLKAVFKTVYGQPIATYMKEYRVRRAMHLLRETGDTIANIAAAVGYESQGKFAHVFRSIAGVTPSEYRRQAQRRT